VPISRVSSSNQVGRKESWTPDNSSAGTNHEIAGVGDAGWGMSVDVPVGVENRVTVGEGVLNAARVGLRCNAGVEEYSKKTVGDTVSDEDFLVSVGICKVERSVQLTRNKLKRRANMTIL
jgi:hypothetical protein